METPRISVLMVNYNQEDLIAQSIECVLNQTYRNLQFLIVDDGSTDSSPEIIRRYAQKDDRIEYYPMEKNMHISYAMICGTCRSWNGSWRIWRKPPAVRSALPEQT